MKIRKLFVAVLFFSSFFSGTNFFVSANSVSSVELTNILTVPDTLIQNNNQLEVDRVETFTNEEIIAYLKSIGELPPEFQLDTRLRANGVNKIIWYKGYLNYDLYLTKDIINKINSSNTTLGLSILGFMIGGPVAAVIFPVIKIWVTSGMTPHGKVFVVRGGTRQYWYYQ
ncbi:MAG: hypothetical protein LBV67_06910 [Streptococcaceae bacterium]|jgi:hypothetical protein|nr:hypothetical protein [Streptococcaceae bacterium]